MTRISKGAAKRTFGTFLDRRDVDPQLARFASEAAQRARLGGAADKKLNRVAYEILRSNGTSDATLTVDAEWAAYLTALPKYDVVGVSAHLRPLLAFLSWRVKPLAEFRNVHHMIVDEAQDVHPLEWELLNYINKGSWTLLGDLNQRRSDFTYSSWEQAQQALGVRGEEATPVIHTLERGYRSTRQILRFANKLLNRGDRELESLQDGVDPLIHKARRDDLGLTAVLESVELLARHPGGTAAVLTADPRPVEAAFRSLDWMQPKDANYWMNGDESITLMTPDQARGLEFDGVVVVEPSAFPLNFGRHGPLYTSLTRGNRELVVVHSQPLPGPLTPRK